MRDSPRYVIIEQICCSSRDEIYDCPYFPGPVSLYEHALVYEFLTQAFLRMPEHCRIKSYLPWVTRIAGIRYQLIYVDGNGRNVRLWFVTPYTQSDRVSCDFSTCRIKIMPTDICEEKLIDQAAIMQSKSFLVYRSLR